MSRPTNPAIGTLVLDKRPLVSIEKTTSLANALEIMETNRILSVPVKGDAETPPESEDLPYIGVIDITDILMYVAFGNFKEVEGMEIAPPAPEQLSGEKLSSIFAGDIVGIALKIQTGSFYSGVYEVSPNTPLSEILHLTRGGIQRILIRPSNDQFKVLSQIDILNHLAAVADELKPITSQTVEEADLLRPEEFNELCVVNEKTIVLTAYRRMLKYKGDALAVVDDSGKLMTTMSPSDLRMLWEKTKDLKLVLGTVGEFLKVVYGGFLRPPISVRKTDTVAKAMTHCVLGKVHRVWVVDDEDKPIQCVRIQDILSKFQGAL